MSEDGQWMSKAELAAARGISLASADRLVRRRKWRRQKGNDGRVRVLVPAGTASDVPEENAPTEALIDQLRERVAALDGQLLGQSEAMTAAHAAELDRLKQSHREEIGRLLGLIRQQRRWWWWRFGP